MSRESQTSHKIALLATGDEIANGDIMNSNSQQIASRLSSEGMNVRMHMTAPDTVHEIEDAIAFLLKTHDALIITGGLGPTSDDLTRFALGKVLELPLIFDDKTWDDICTRLKRFGYTAPPESNRQQALFPQGATIIPNPNGTAAGSLTPAKKKIVFMLPGPPNECLPMVDSVVLTTLKDAGFQKISHHHKWFLFGASEGQIAEELDQLAKPYDCVTGYRLFYPYIEFKLHSNNLDDLTALVEVIGKSIEPYLIGDGQQIASKLLRHKLRTSQYQIAICDQATGGALQAVLESPQTRKHLFFSNDPKHFPENFLRIEINGLAEFWEEKAGVTHTHLEIGFTDGNQQNKVSVNIPYRGRRVMQYAVEYICSQIYKLLEQKDQV